MKNVDRYGEEVERGEYKKLTQSEVNNILKYGADKDILSSCLLENIDFKSVNIDNLNFRNSILRECIFENSKICNSNFQETELWNVEFKKSNILNCNFQETKLYNSGFNSCDVKKNDFILSKFSKTTIFNSKLYSNNFELSEFLSCSGIKNVDGKNNKHLSSIYVNMGGATHNEIKKNNETILGQLGKDKRFFNKKLNREVAFER